MISSWETPQSALALPKDFSFIEKPFISGGFIQGVAVALELISDAHFHRKFHFTFKREDT